MPPVAYAPAAFASLAKNKKKSELYKQYEKITPAMSHEIERNIIKVCYLEISLMVVGTGELCPVCCIQFYKGRSLSLFHKDNGECQAPLKMGLKTKIADQGMEWYGVVEDVLLDAKQDYWVRASYDRVKGAEISIKDPRVCCVACSV